MKRRITIFLLLFYYTFSLSAENLIEDAIKLVKTKNGESEKLLLNKLSQISDSLKIRTADAYFPELTELKYSIFKDSFFSSSKAFRLSVANFLLFSHYSSKERMTYDLMRFNFFLKSKNSRDNDLYIKTKYQILLSTDLILLERMNKDIFNEILLKIYVEE